MDATHAIPDFDPRRDAVACAALLLAMVISAACAAFIVDVEVSGAPTSTPIEAPALCVARGVSIF